MTGVDDVTKVEIIRMIRFVMVLWKWWLMYDDDSTVMINEKYEKCDDGWPAMTMTMTMTMTLITSTIANCQVSGSRSGDGWCEGICANMLLCGVSFDLVIIIIIIIAVTNQSVSLPCYHLSISS